MLKKCLWKQLIELKAMSKNKQSIFKIVDIDFKNGWTITTLVDKNKLQQQHLSINVIESFFGGKTKTQEGNNGNNNSN